MIIFLAPTERQCGVKLQVSVYRSNAGMEHSRHQRLLKSIHTIIKTKGINWSSLNINNNNLSILLSVITTYECSLNELGMIYGRSLCGQTARESGVKVSTDNQGVEFTSLANVDATQVSIFRNRPVMQQNCFYNAIDPS